MSDMGIFRTSIAIENPVKRGTFRTIADVMVDTGSEYTWVPRAELEALDIMPERTARFRAADGRELERWIAFANVYAGDTSAPDIVVFAEPDDMTLLGARALEGLNLRIDLVNKVLVPAGPVPVAFAARASAMCTDYKREPTNKSSGRRQVKVHHSIRRARSTLSVESEIRQFAAKQ